MAGVGEARKPGVRTAGGAGFSTSFPPGSLGRASAYGGRVTGGAVILLTVGDTTQAIYAVTGCRLRPTVNVEHQRWDFNFDEESDDVRSGAGCITVGSARQLVGYRVGGDPDGTAFDVTRSSIRLSEGGRRAEAGRSVILGRALPAVSGIVRTALAVSCGPGPGVTQPA